MAYDRNEVLGRTDLGELADQLVGPHKGRGSGATWPCPDPGHGNQTGKTPPVSIFRTSYGDERWRCHSCGAGGTAIDLVMTTQGVRFPEAIELLARRAGVAAVDRPPPALRTARIQRPEPARPTPPSPEVERFVAAAEGYLWSEQGGPMQQWLAERGLGEEVLRANRVGADPGPAGLDRAPGLPRGGPAVVLPVLGPDGQAAYLQSRYLSPRGHKYDNPSAALAGALPRIAEVRLPRPADNPDLVVVSEGIPDALVAAQAGYRAVAVLGAGVPDERAAAALVERFPTERLVVAFDADAPGRAGAERLEELLGERGAGERVVRLEVPVSAGDLNGWQQLAGANFGDELTRAMTHTIETEPSMPAEPSRPGVDRLASKGPSTAASVGPEQAQHETRQDGLLPTTRAPATATEFVTATRSGSVESAARQDSSEWDKPELIDRLETIHYHHVLIDDPGVAAANVAHLEQAINNWTRVIQARTESHERELPHPAVALAPAPGMAELDQRLEQFAYRHVLVDDPHQAHLNLDMARSTVRGWSSELTPTTAAELVPAARAPDDRIGAQRWAFDHGLSPTPVLEPAELDPAPPELGGLAIDF